MFGNFFILNEEAVEFSMKYEDTFKFPYKYGDYSLMSEDTQTTNVAYHQQWIEKIMTENKLKVDCIRYGFWCGRDRTKYPDFQDIMIVSKIDV